MNILQADYVVKTIAGQVARGNAGTEGTAGTLFQYNNAASGDTAEFSGGGNAIFAMDTGDKLVLNGKWTKGDVVLDDTTQISGVTYTNEKGEKVVVSGSANVEVKEPPPPPPPAADETKPEPKPEDPPPTTNGGEDPPPTGKGKGVVVSANVKKITIGNAMLYQMLNGAGDDTATVGEGSGNSIFTTDAGDTVTLNGTWTKVGKKTDKKTQLTGMLYTNNKNENVLISGAGKVIPGTKPVDDEETPPEVITGVLENNIKTPVIKTPKTPFTFSDIPDVRPLLTNGGSLDTESPINFSPGSPSTLDGIMSNLFSVIFKG